MPRFECALLWGSTFTYKAWTGVPQILCNEQGSSLGPGLYTTVDLFLRESRCQGLYMDMSRGRSHVDAYLGQLTHSNPLYKQKSGQLYITQFLSSL